MAAPLLVLALIWDRLGVAGRQRLRGREVQLGPVRRHVTVVISSVLFIVLGLAFIVFQGGNGLSGFYASLGVADLALAVEIAVRDALERAPAVVVLLMALPLLLLVALVRRSVLGTRLDGPEGHE